MVTRSVLKQERLAQNICIFWLQIAKIYWHAQMRRIQRTTSSNVTIHTSPSIQFGHNDKINGLGQVATKTTFLDDRSFLSLVRDPTDVALPQKRRTTVVFWRWEETVLSLTSAGRSFRMRVPETKKARRPIVGSLTAWTSRSSDEEDRSLCRDGMSVIGVNCRRYCRASPWITL